MRRALIALGLSVALITVAGGSAHAFGGAELSASACGGGELVINVTHKVVNDADSGVLGNAWAFDAYNRHIQVWQGQDDTFCATVSYTGQFVTNDGGSPGGTGTVADGIQGTMNGGYRTTHFTGTLASETQTRGNLGTNDYDCDLDFNCDFWSWVSTYFSSTSGFDLEWWGWEYHAGNNGVWINAIDGNSGDITG